MTQGTTSIVGAAERWKCGSSPWNVRGYNEMPSFHQSGRALEAVQRFQTPTILPRAWKKVNTLKYRLLPLQLPDFRGTQGGRTPDRRQPVDAPADASPRRPVVLMFPSLSIMERRWLSPGMLFVRCPGCGASPFIVSSSMSRNVRGRASGHSGFVSPVRADRIIRGNDA
jgi:hypothetical protein